MTFANNLDPDEAPQIVGLHLRSKLFDIQIIYWQKIWYIGHGHFLQILKKKYLKKKLASMQRVEYIGRDNVDLHYAINASMLTACLPGYPDSHRHPITT